MSRQCPQCGQEAEIGRFCAKCGAELPPEAPSTPPDDPMIGKVLAERYEVIEQLGEGGMGRIYKGLHAMLQRDVAIKCIHPHLSLLKEIEGRFMVEARAVAGLQHPNIVSIYDFGRAPKDLGGHLYIVMELLKGRELAEILLETPLLPIEQVTEIMLQLLAALAEAHAADITHRDVKPSNLMVEPTRGGRGRIKLIDFGIAATGDGRKLTAVGQIVGTPHYLSPEQILGQRVGASNDLYAAGVTLFELLTGQMPFDAETPDALLSQQLEAARPDPRQVAPDGREVPDALAELCLRSIDRDPEKRFPDAESFAEALMAAAGMTSSAALDFDRPSRPNSAPEPIPNPAVAATSPALSAPDPQATSPVPVSLPKSPVPLPRSEPSELPKSPVPLPKSPIPVSRPKSPVPIRRSEPAPAVRDDDSAPKPTGARDVALADRAPFLNDLLNDEIPAVLVSGRPGVGRSWVLRETTAMLERTGHLAIAVGADLPPHHEVAYLGVRKVILALLGRTVTDGPPPTDDIEDRTVARGLRLVFAQEAERDDEKAGEPSAAVSAALEWACRGALERAAGAPVVLAIDDLDRFDAPSNFAVADLVAASRLDGLRVLVTSMAPPGHEFADQICHHELTGWSRDAALDQLGESADALKRADDDIEPLYVEQLRHWKRKGHDAAPSKLANLVGSNLRALSPDEQRVMLAIAILGGAPLHELDEFLESSVDLNNTLMTLADRRLVDSSDGMVRAAHVMMADAIVGIASKAAVANAHRKAAERAAAHSDSLELRAHHAVLGDPGFDSFMLAEDSARLRLDRGDLEGAVDILSAGVVAARDLAAKGGTDAELAGSASIVFARKLGGALLGLERIDEARALLEDAFQRTKPDALDRALILEQLAAAAHLEGNDAEAERIRDEAVSLAKELGDEELAERVSLAGLETPTRTEVARRLVSQAPYHVSTVPPSHRATSVVGSAPPTPPAEGPAES